jgi:hypothetical protein
MLGTRIISLVVEEGTNLPEFAKDDVYDLSAGNFYDAIIGFAFKGNDIPKQDNGGKAIRRADQERRVGFEPVSTVPSMTQPDRKVEQDLPSVSNLVSFQRPFRI